MHRTISLRPRKEPQQERSQQMRDDILDAGVRVLQREGPLRFTMLTGPFNLAWSCTDGRAVAAPLLAPKLPSRPYPFQGAGERSQVAHKQIWLLHRREVTAALELAPVDDVREASLGEAPNG
jgi:hypothetical protein